MGAGMYCNQEAGMYFDPTTQGYFSASEQTWYKYDGASQQYVPWQS